MPKTADFAKDQQPQANIAYEVLSQKAKNLGEIMQKNPRFQSNSPELYLLAYLKELGLAKV